MKNVSCRGQVCGLILKTQLPDNTVVFAISKLAGKDQMGLLLISFQYPIEKGVGQIMRKHYKQIRTHPRIPSDQIQRLYSFSVKSSTILLLYSSLVFYEISNDHWMKENTFSLVPSCTSAFISANNRKLKSLIENHRARKLNLKLHI